MIGGGHALVCHGCLFVGVIDCPPGGPLSTIITLRDNNSDKVAPLFTSIFPMSSSPNKLQAPKLANGNFLLFNLPQTLCFEYIIALLRNTETVYKTRVYVEHFWTLI